MVFYREIMRIARSVKQKKDTRKGATYWSDENVVELDAEGKKLHFSYCRSLVLWSFRKSPHLQV